MKKLNIHLQNSNYKSFKKDFEQTLEGDLIIISGVNGTGKTQLLNIIADKMESAKNVTRRILCNDIHINKANIFVSSFRDNINIAEFGKYNVNIRKSAKESAWKVYSQTKFNIASMMQYPRNPKEIHPSNFIKSAGELLEILKEKYPEKYLNLLETEFNDAYPEDFFWMQDDTFTANIGNMFGMFACKRETAAAKRGRGIGGFSDDVYNKDAPWTKLNELFAFLKFNYRFKTNYEFEMPNLKEEPRLLAFRDGKTIEAEIRNLVDLSDGEKNIITLTMAAFDEECHKNIKLALFDEYDATLNPSLTDAFFKVIKKYYLDKNIQVIITTHSPATISMAPDDASFYEIFRNDEDSPKIYSISKEEYSELKIANKAFYDKISDQGERILQLEQIKTEVNSLKSCCIFVEDEHTQIYKLAWLKLNDKEFTKDTLEDVFDTECSFAVFGKGGCGNLQGFLNNPQMDEWNDKKVIGLFDFDDAYKNYKKCDKLFNQELGSETSGLYKKRTKYNVYAMMLPIPEYRKNIAKKDFKDSYLEVELLFTDDDIEQAFGKYKCATQKIPGNITIPEIKNKSVFWEKCLDFDKTKFSAFQRLFNNIMNIFND